MAPSTPTDISPLAALLRRYAYAYTACHDLTVCDEIMVEDYRLKMGPFEAKGRDETYKPTAAQQFRQFPGLGFTVHDLVLSRDRAALHFTEHGYSPRHGRPAAWHGVSLYRWDGERLLECRVEQDYFARRAQLRGEAAPVMSSPGIDPWSAAPGGHDESVHAAALGWLRDGGLGRIPVGGMDDETHRASARVVLDDMRTEVLDLFVADDRAAFHAVVEGRYAGGLPGCDDVAGAAGQLYVAGLVTFAEGRVVRATAVSDRLAFERRLRRRP